MKILLSIAFALTLVAVSMAQAPVAIEKELIGYADNVTKYGSYGGEYDGDKLDKNNTALKNALVKYGKRSDVLVYKFPKLDNKMYVVTSRDGRFRVYSWDTSDGGTMHNFDNVFQYRGKSGKVYTWTRTDAPEGDSGSFFTQLFQTDTPAGTVYLGTSTFIGSTSLAGQTISAFQINGEKLDPNAKVIKTRSGVTNSISFGYDFFSVVDHPERPVKLFFYDDTKKSFRFPVVIENSKTPQGRVTNRYITYRFDGKYFVKVS
jgi:hypothetical protein